MYPYISVFGRQIGTYGLCMAAAVLLAAFLACLRAKKRGVQFEDVIIVGAAALGFALVGGGLLYIFVTYSLQEIFAMIKAGQFGFLGGGIVFYGGLIGGIVGAFVGVRIAKCKFSDIESCVVPFIPLGHAIGRVGCLMAGCCHGFAYDGPLAIHYPHSIMGLSPHQGYFPTPILESVLNLGIFAYLLHCSKKQSRKFELLIRYLGCYGILRFLLEFFRGDSVRGALWVFSTSQWISLGILAVVGIYLLIAKKTAKR